MTLAHASLVSKLVNLDAVKLPMDQGQLKEAAWQFLASVTERGAIELSALGLSTRSVASKFGGMSPQTVATMLGRMAAVSAALSADAFHPSWCDPLTGWPRWKEARGAGGLPFQDVSDDVRSQRQLEKCAAAIAKLQERFGAEVYVRAAALLAQEDTELTSES